MRFLFTSLQYKESDFYGRVGRRLEEGGDSASHITVSRRAARSLQRSGATAYCIGDRLAGLEAAGPLDIELEAARITREYDVPTLRELYRIDRACAGRSEEWCVRRTVAHFLALEDLFDFLRPDVLVPEPGCETIRTVAHLIARRRGIRTFFLFYTVFDEPLRISEDGRHGPIAGPSDLRPLSEEERDRVEALIHSCIERDAPLRGYYRRSLSWRLAPLMARHLLVHALQDRDNEYLKPVTWLRQRIASRVRERVAAPVYDEIPGRPFVYFPLQVAHDFKIQRITPHLYDQGAVVDLIARALPHGYDLVIKEHPLSIGRTPIARLRRLKRLSNVHLVAPSTSSHELIRRARGTAVISSTVGLEALMHGKPVLTMGRPFFSGAGVTLDVESTAELRRAVPRLLDFQPDRETVLQFLHAAMERCRPGLPVLGDRSDENAAVLARTLEAAARRPADTPLPTPD